VGFATSIPLFAQKVIVKIKPAVENTAAEGKLLEKLVGGHNLNCCANMCGWCCHLCSAMKDNFSQS
jgi:hypothetical protein